MTVFKSADCDRLGRDGARNRVPAVARAGFVPSVTPGRAVPPEGEDGAGSAGGARHSSASVPAAFWRLLPRKGQTFVFGIITSSYRFNHLFVYMIQETLFSVPFKNVLFLAMMSVISEVVFVTGQ